MRADNPTRRQRSIATVLINGASFEDLVNAHTEGAFTWRTRPGHPAPGRRSATTDPPDQHLRDHRRTETRSGDTCTSRSRVAPVPDSTRERRTLPDHADAGQQQAGAFEARVEAPAQPLRRVVREVPTRARRSRALAEFPVVECRHRQPDPAAGGFGQSQEGVSHADIVHAARVTISRALSCRSCGRPSSAAHRSASNSRRKAASARRSPVSVNITDLALLTGSEISPLR